jgi:hypothetical protein
MTSSGPLSEDPQFRTVWAPDQYRSTTDRPVRLRRVLRRGAVMGYLWASETDDAAGFVARARAGDDGLNVSVAWVERLRSARAQGLGPLQALRRWVDAAEDPHAGRVDGAEYSVGRLDELVREASR